MFGFLAGEDHDGDEAWDAGFGQSGALELCFLSVFDHFLEGFEVIAPLLIPLCQVIGHDDFLHFEVIRHFALLLIQKPSPLLNHIINIPFFCIFG